MMPELHGWTIGGGGGSLGALGLTADATELNYVDGVTSAIQTQLNAIAAKPFQSYAMARVDAARNLVDDTSNQALFASTEDELTVVSGMTYRFRASYALSKGVNSVHFRVLCGGTATFTTIGYTSQAFIVLNPNVQTTSSRSRQTSFAAAAVVAAGTAINQTIDLDGTFEVNVGGTIIPQVSLSAASGSTPTVLVDTYFEVWPIGANPITIVGSGWS